MELMDAQSKDTPALPPYLQVMLKSKMVRSRDKRRLKNELSVLRKLPPSRFLQRCHDAFHTSARSSHGPSRQKDKRTKGALIG